MSVRSSAARLLIHAGVAVGAIFTVSILLAAVPGHNPPTGRAVGLPQQQGSLRSQTNPDAGAEKAKEKAAASDTSHKRGGRPHLYGHPHRKV